MEGVAAELSTDIQYARSEAAQRNAAVGIVFGTNCYTVYLLGTTAAKVVNHCDRSVYVVRATPESGNT